MAEQQPTAAAAESDAPHQFEVGQIVEFAGYKEVDLAEGDLTPLIDEGSRVKITNIFNNNDGDVQFHILAVDEGGKPVDKDRADTVYPNEVNFLEPPEPEAEAQPAAARTRSRKAPAKSSDKKGAKASAKKSGSTKAASPKKPTKAAAKAPAKGGPKASGGKAAKTGGGKAAKTSDAKTGAKGKKTAATKGKGKDTTAQAAPEAPQDDRRNSVEYHDAAVLDIIAQEKGIEPAAAKLLERQEEIYFTLGGVLCRLQEEQPHIAAGYEDSKAGFGEYCEATLGLHRRRTYHYIKIYRTFRTAGLGHADLQELGWTKARVLARIDAEKLSADKDELLDFAKKHSRDELEKYVQKEYIDTESRETIARRRFNFSLLGEEGAQVEEALEEAKKQVEDGDANKAIHKVATEWLQFVNGVETQQPSGLPTNGDELTEYAAEKLGLAIVIEGPVEG